MKDNIFLILGGDDRSLYLGEYLEKQSFKVCYYAFNQTDCYKTLTEAVLLEKLLNCSISGFHWANSLW